MAKNLKAMLSNIKARMSLRRGSSSIENSGNTSPHKVIGLNTSLVSECVAYLKQPKSLREEGLFRVPGDCNQVIMYLKQFDYSLKPNLEDELDPNNVSSLLKLHIRNNGGLLGKKEAGDMYAAVRQKNIEEIDSVIKTTSAAQQSILKEVLFLFKEVAEHEDENKMCSGAIATSCGLSIFPVVNAGNANLMLKVLIDNVEEIFQQ